MMARRSAFAAALRSGSVASRARAAARMRLPSLGLAGQDLIAAREARARLGHIIRQERLRRIAAPAAARPNRPAAARSDLAHAVTDRNRMLALAVGIALVAITAVTLLPRDVLEREGDGRQPATSAGPQPAEAMVARPVIRGLLGITSPLFVTPSVVPVAVMTPAPATTARPQSSAPVGGGSSSGGGGDAAVRRPVPAVAPTGAAFLPSNGLASLPPLTPGFRRFQGLVVDAQGVPLADVCVVIGPRGCQPVQPHTDAIGSWYVDLPVGAMNLNWDIHFVKAGYDSVATRINSATAPTTLTLVRLVKTRA